MNFPETLARTPGCGLLVACTALLAACAAPSLPTGPATAGPTAFHGRQATDYFATRKSPASLERCLADSLPVAHADRGHLTTLYIGPASADADWIITLGDNGAGTNLSMYRPVNDSGTPEESELRYNLARCTT